jgi:hypothetical protein
MSTQPVVHACANEGCPRTPSPGEPLCETCAIERSLFERDTRPDVSSETESLERELFRRDTRPDEVLAGG